jgi:hypothetical protein
MIPGMPRYLLDIASYQGPLALADVVRAGFTAVNLKTSHGLGKTTVHPKVATYVAEAKALKLGISTFHWLIGNETGAKQAEHAYARLVDLGLDRTAAHVVDVEEQDDADAEAAPTRDVVRDYVTVMQRLLRRPIMLYTGDWWWNAAGRWWNGAAMTPYLMAAPNDGYPGSYPGDASPKWSAGYGGWVNLSCMQYAVEPLFFPDGSKGGIDVSKSVIRDPAVWKSLTTSIQPL